MRRRSRLRGRSPRTRALWTQLVGWWQQGLLKPELHAAFPLEKFREAMDKIGLESARMGVPALVAFNGSWAAMPVDDFLEWGQTRDEYFAKLRSRLQEPLTLDRLSRAYRWYNLYHLGATVDMSDIVPSSEFNTLPDYRTPSQAEAIESIFLRGGDATELTMQRLQREQTPGSAEAESTEIQRQMRRLIHFLFTGEDSTDDVPLSISMGSSIPSESSGEPTTRRAISASVNTGGA